MEWEVSLYTRITLKKKLENSWLGLSILWQVEANSIYWAQGQNGQMRNLRGLLEILNHPCGDRGQGSAALGEECGPAELCGGFGWS